jgi:hypothetical protein
MVLADIAIPSGFGGTSVWAVISFPPYDTSIWKMSPVFTDNPFPEKI